MSAFDAVISALAPKAADELEGVQVLDGWDREKDLADLVLVLGFAPTPGTPAGTVRRDEDADGFGTVETVTIACTAASWDGDLDYAGKGTQVADLLTRLRDLLAAESRADRRLGGTVLRAYLGTASQWYREVDERGATVQCDFAVVAEVHGP